MHGSKARGTSSDNSDTTVPRGHPDHNIYRSREEFKPGCSSSTVHKEGGFNDWNTSNDQTNTLKTRDLLWEVPEVILEMVSSSAISIRKHTHSVDQVSANEHESVGAIDNVR